jgi:hypothetical protein
MVTGEDAEQVEARRGHGEDVTCILRSMGRGGVNFRIGSNNMQSASFQGYCE